jgi:hypothetical protein
MLAGHGCSIVSKAVPGATVSLRLYCHSLCFSVLPVAGLLLCAKCWQAMAAAAAGMGDTEVAYCLYAKGYSQCSNSAAAAAAAGANTAVAAVVQQLAAGQLQMLTALCEVPSSHQQQQQLQGICKRWQRMKERFQLTAPSSSSSNSSSREGAAAGSRVVCVSDLHVDKAGGANMAWLRRISSSAFLNDVLIVAGELLISLGLGFRGLGETKP